MEKITRILRILERRLKMSKRKEFKLKKCTFKHLKKHGKKQALEYKIGRFIQFVHCLICDAYGPSALTDYWAIKKWNERIR